MTARILLIGLLMVSGSIVSAQVREVPISQRTVNVSVDISNSTLKWSSADYSRPVVKVLVPELAKVTILDHRNTGEGAPCLASYQAETPEEVIQNNPSSELIPMTIILKKILSPDPANHKCHVVLSESVESQIRGFKFEHLRALDVGDRDIGDCK